MSLTLCVTFRHVQHGHIEVLELFLLPSERVMMVASITLDQQHVVESSSYDPRPHDIPNILAFNAISLCNYTVFNVIMLTCKMDEVLKLDLMPFRSSFLLWLFDWTNLMPTTIPTTHTYTCLTDRGTKCSIV